MKAFKFGLRIWITFSSVLVFLVSWVVFCHSPKPVDTNAATGYSVPTLEPLPPMPGFGDQGLQLSAQNNRRPMRSVFVTGGS
jgi:hypothetical protein